MFRIRYIEKNSTSKTVFYSDIMADSIPDAYERITKDKNKIVLSIVNVTLTDNLKRD